jgi:hypothetical protein
MNKSSFQTKERMAGGRDGGGGRTAAAMLPILHHGEEVVKVADGDF